MDTTNIRELKELPAIDAALLCYIEPRFRKIFSAAFPQFDETQTIELMKTASRLLDDSTNLLQKNKIESLQITEDFTKITKDKFTEFNSLIIQRYLYWGRLGIHLGASYDKDINYFYLIKIGYYNAAAFLDKRAGLSNEKLFKKLSIFNTNYLFVLFPFLFLHKNKVTKIEARVNELADYCHNCKEYKLQLNERWDVMLTTIRVNNPHFLEKSYQNALDYASRSLR